MAFAIEILLKALIVGKGSVDASNPGELLHVSHRSRTMKQAPLLSRVQGVGKRRVSIACCCSNAFGFSPEITGTHLNPKLLCPKANHCMSSVWRFVHIGYAIGVDVDYRFV